MKASELMLDDWVEFPHGRDRVQELSYIQGHGYCASFAASATLFSVEVEKLEPVPLTGEVLEKNGFGYIERDTISGITHFYLGEPQFCRNMDLHIGTDNNGHFWLNYLRNDINRLRYVHELQHAFRLLRIDMVVAL